MQSSMLSYHISTHIHAHRARLEPGWELTGREEKPYAEKQDLSVLTTEECAIEVVIKGRGLPHTIACVPSSVCSKVWGGIAT